MKKLIKKLIKEYKTEASKLFKICKGDVDSKHSKTWNDAQYTKLNEIIDDLEKVLKKYDALPDVSICVCGTEVHKELAKRANGMTYCGKCNKPY